MSKQKAYREKRRKRFQDGVPTALDIRHRERERKRSAQNIQKKKILTSKEAQSLNAND